MTEAPGKGVPPTLRLIGTTGGYRRLIMLKLAALVGVAAGLLVTAMSWVAQHLHMLLVVRARGGRLSAQPDLRKP